MIKNAFLLLSLFILAGVFIGCSTSQKTLNDHKKRDLLKQLAYCKCIEHAMEKFTKVDSTEMGSEAVEISLEYYGMDSRKVEPILDSLARFVISRQLNAKTDTIGKHESSWGKTDYILGCLKLYKSKQLDSLVRTFKRSDYTISFDSIQK